MEQHALTLTYGGDLPVRATSRKDPRRETVPISLVQQPSGTLRKLPGAWDETWHHDLCTLRHYHDDDDDGYCDVEYERVLVHYYDDHIEIEFYRVYGPYQDQLVDSIELHYPDDGMPLLCSLPVLGEGRFHLRLE
ncbi:hypothetical protein F-E9_260 [Faustovirus]|nr:hypothetical protein F-E9_260 [Faustovirus]